MTILMYFGCDTDTIMVMKYMPERTYSFPVKKNVPGEQAYDDPTVESSATLSFESPKLATGCQLRFTSRIGNKLPVCYSHIPNHELAVSLSLSICLLLRFGKKLARNNTLPITFLHLFGGNQLIRKAPFAHPYTLQKYIY